MNAKAAQYLWVDVGQIKETKTETKTARFL
jgi:hypothetical protein